MMYLWVILATFLAVLASYTLSIRPDMRAVTIEPVAEASLGKFLAQHQAALKYVKYQKPPYTPGFQSGDKKSVNYTAAVIDEDELQNEMAYGFSLSGEYTSQIFCMTPDMTSSIEAADPCNTENVRRMVVTYGAIPQRWLNTRAGYDQPNSDFMAAMRKMVNGGEYCGYIAPVRDIDESSSNPSGSAVRLADRSGTVGIFVPLAVVENVNFKSECDLADNKICLVYMSSI